jgi:hypothetical protein
VREDMRHKEEVFVPSEIIPDRRQGRTLSDADVVAIARALRAIDTDEHECKFGNITQEELQETIKFAKKMNKVIDGGAGIVGKVILVSIVVYILSLVGAGFISDMFSRFTK